jgi:quinol monooxygenase YgiN
MKSVVITHEVKKYSDWRKVYDADEGNRTKAGIHLTGVYQSVNNPNLITLIGEAPSVEALTSFMADPKLKAAMEQGGVIGMPDVKILNKL